MKNKNIILFCIILLIVLILLSLFLIVNNQMHNKNSNKYISNIQSSNIDNNKKQNIKNIKMTIKEETLTPFGTTFIIETDDNFYFCNEWFRIDRKENDKWKEAKRINSNYSFVAISYNLDKNKKFENNVRWYDLYGELKKGEYRLVKSINTSNGQEIHISAEFVIDEY